MLPVMTKRIFSSGVQWMFLPVLVVAFCINRADAGEEVSVASGGEAGLPVVVAEDADAEFREEVELWLDVVERMTGAEFDIMVGSGDAGIVIGVPGEFSDLPFNPGFEDGAFSRDDYVLRSAGEGVYILGATPLAAQFGMWDLLYRAGYRYFFPHEDWEIVPDMPEWSVALDVRESPDYYVRRGPRGASRMRRQPWALEGWRRWQVRNRTASSFSLSTGHVYNRVIRANQDAFDENPEYWGLVDGDRTSRAQPNVAHPDVQQIFIDYALNTLRNDPGRDSVSMEPRDGNPWSESEESRGVGRPSEQAVFIANKVAEAVVEEFGEVKYVGMYGYSHHSPPPRMDVHPNVIVSLATGFIRGGYTFDRMLEGWGERAQKLGIRDFYTKTVFQTRSNFLPGGSRASNTEYMRNRLPEYYAAGARFMNSSSDNTWGGNGLGYYLSSRILWDIGEADRMDEIIDDFLEKCFGPSKEPMREFYNLIDGSAKDPYVPYRSRPRNDDMVHRMYRSLAEARTEAEGLDDVLARIDGLVLYTRFFDLYRVMGGAGGEARQEALDELASFIWRIRERVMAPNSNMLSHLNRYFVSSDENLSWPEGAGGSGYPPADIYREREDEPFSEEEILSILEDGMERHKIVELDFEPVDYEGHRPVPAGLDSDAPRGKPLDTHFPMGNRGAPRVYVHTRDGKLPTLYFSSGHIYDNRGPLVVTLYDGQDNEIDVAEIPPGETRRSREDWRNRKDTHRVDWEPGEPGLYRLDFFSTGQGFFWDYEPRGGSSVTVRADAKYALARNRLRRHYFYVPVGTREIVLYGGLRERFGRWYPAGDETIDWDDIRREQNFSVISVPEGRDGKIWAFGTRHDFSELRFLNIPGYLAYHPSELLLPGEYAEELDERGEQAQF